MRVLVRNVHLGKANLYARDDHRTSQHSKALYNVRRDRLDAQVMESNRSKY